MTPITTGHASLLYHRYLSGMDFCMIDTPSIVDLPRQSIAFIPLTVPRGKIREVMGPGLGELNATLSQQGITPTGPWFTHHLRMDPEVFDFEICMPVAEQFAASGRVQRGERPALTVAQTIYHGPYEGLGAAWGEFGAWIAAEGLATTEDLWECYLAGPESGPDPSGWRTQFIKPLIGQTKAAVTIE